MTGPLHFRFQPTRCGPGLNLNTLGAVNILGSESSICTYKDGESFGLPEGKPKLFEKLKVQAAAQIWAAGVPWDEALQIAKRAVEASEPQSRKGQGKGKGKGAAKGRGRS